MIGSDTRDRSRSRRPVGACTLAASAVAVVAISASLCAPVEAQPRPKAPADGRAGVPAAQALFDEGKRLVARGDLAHACPKLEESQRLDPAIGTQYHLADCYERSGRTASAWSTFLEAAAAARKADERERERAARDRARALEPRLARVAVVVGERVAGLAITRAGVAVGEAQWGMALPVDPGSVVVRATAPGKKPFEATVEARAPGKAVEVRIPTLEDDPAAAPAPLVAAPAASDAPADSAAPAPAAAPPVRRERSQPETPRADGTREAVAIALGGLGVVGVGLGTGFGIKSMAHGNSADSHCRGDLCDSAGVKLRENAIAAGNVSTLTFVIGAAALGGGAVLWFTAPRSERRTDPPTTAVHAERGVRVGVGVSDVRLEGRW